MSNSATAAPPQPSKVSQQTVEKAINALLKWRDSKSKTQKPQLLEQDDFIYLIVTLKKIPQKGRTNPHKILLPHPFINPIEDAPEFCLIIDDRSKSRVSKDVATKKIKAENIPISKVLKLSKLMTDYRPFEAKRKLCDSYDVFFADKGVIPLLPRLLGKQFFKKKKIPLPVDLKHKNWKEQIDRACSSCLLYLRTGTCSVVKVGKVSMGAKDVMENVMAAINGIAEIVPSKWGNIRSFHLKLLESLALPIYQTVPDLRLKIEVPTKEESKQGETAKETLKDDDKMDDSLSNKMLKKKGRIHEIRYMDSNISEIPDEDEFGDEGEATENDAMDSAETKAKRRKGDKVKNAKPLKKMAKVKKGDEDGLEQKKKVERGSDSGGKEKKKKVSKNLIGNTRSKKRLATE
ncbi:putative ribosome biogenesis protein C8F11.04 [Carica papaya]|uniref:putative ribosome biogenesis protein C8F11.04 n=1 Tax=Carica papaya TaxID=3649 RepID=UPI000B8CBBEC|nr:putative ribosome biogenesis protein C8F11.04 [Carica papaya]